MDPTGHDSLFFYLAHVHPLVMATGLLVAGLALRTGLEIRRRRRRAQPPGAALRRRHLALAKPAVVVLVLGFVGGPASSYWLRDWTPFERLHGWVGLLALALFVATAALGRRLEEGRRSAADTHAALAMLAILAGGVAAFTGFVLLP